MEHLGHSWPWQALEIIGAYQLTAAGLDALARRVTRTATHAVAEHHHTCTGTTPIQQAHLGTHLQSTTRPTPASPPAPDEIAERLGTTPGSAKSSTCIGLQRLKAIMTRRGQ